MLSCHIVPHIISYFIYVLKHRIDVPWLTFFLELILFCFVQYDGHKKDSYIYGYVNVSGLTCDHHLVGVTHRAHKYAPRCIVLYSLLCMFVILVRYILQSILFKIYNLSLGILMFNIVNVVEEFN